MSDKVDIKTSFDNLSDDSLVALGAIIDAYLTRLHFSPEFLDIFGTDYPDDLEELCRKIHFRYCGDRTINTDYIEVDNYAS